MAQDKKLMLFDYETRRNKGQIRFDPKSKDMHMKAVIDTCWNLSKQGHEFFTRARHAKSGTCADIVDIPWHTIIEVQDSEKDASIERKRKFWEGEGFSFEVIRV